MSAVASGCLLGTPIGELLLQIIKEIGRKSFKHFRVGFEFGEATLQLSDLFRALLPIIAYRLQTRGDILSEPVSEVSEIFRGELPNLCFKLFKAHDQTVARFARLHQKANWRTQEELNL
jgi:hypothetical protein